MKHSPTTLIPRLLLLAALVFAGSARAVEKVEQLLKMLPASASIVVSVKSFSELLKDWDSSGIGRFMEDPAVKKWMAPMSKGGEAPWNRFTREESGGTLREEIAVYPGAGVACFDLSGCAEDEDSKAHVVSLSEIAGKEAEFAAYKARELEAKKKKDHPDAVLRSEEIAGVKVSIIAEDDDKDADWLEVYAIVEGIAIESDDAKLMEQAIVAVKSGRGTAKNGEQFARVTDLHGGIADVTIHFDLEALGALLEKTMAKRGGLGAGAPFAPAALLNALGLDELKAFAITLDLDAERSTGEFILLHSEKPKGLIPSFIRGVSTDVPRPAFIPAGCDSASVSRQSLGGMYDAVMAGVGKLGPVAAIATAQLDQLEKKAGISLRNDLLGSLQDEFIQAQTIKSAEAGALMPIVSQVTGIKLKDRARFLSALDALKALAGNGFAMFEESEFQDFRIFTFKPSLAGAPGSPSEAGAAQIAYVVTDEYFLFCQGSQDLLRKLLTRMKSPQGGSFWDSPATQQAIAALPKSFTGMSVSNMAPLMKMLADLFTKFETLSGIRATSKSSPVARGPKGSKPGDPSENEPDAANSGLSFDPKAVPADSVFARYFGISTSGNYSYPDATVVRIIALPPATE